MKRLLDIPARTGVVIATTLSLSLAACGGSDSSNPTDQATSKPVAGGTATIGMFDEPNTLDPAAAPAKAAYQILMTLCDGLYTVDEKMTPVPQLATGLPEISSDGRTVTIPLRSGAKFNDGAVFDAAAAKAWIERNIAVKGSSIAPDFVNVKSIDAPDAQHLVFRMVKPDARLLNTLAGTGGMIASPKSLKTFGKKAGTAPVCVSPFALKKWTPGVSISLVKSDQYYDADKVLLDGVNFKIMPDSNARMVNLQSGDVNAALAIAPTDSDKLGSSDKIRVNSQVGIGFQSIVVNTANAGADKPGQIPDNPLAKSPAVREAFNLAIDRKALVAAVSANKSTPGCSMLSPSSPFYDKPDCAPFDLDRAKDLIKQSGVDTPVKVSLLVSSDPVTARLAQIIQSMVKKAGFELTIEPVDPAAALQRITGGDFDVVALSFGGLPDPDANIARFVSSTGFLNGGKQFTEKSERLLAESVTTIDETRRKSVYRELLAEIRSWNATNVLFYPVQIMAAEKTFVGYTWTTGGEIILKSAGFTNK